LQQVTALGVLLRIDVSRFITMVLL